MTTELAALLSEAAQTARFDTRIARALTATHLLHMYQRSEDHWDRKGLAGAQAHLRVDRHAALTDLLGVLLDEYIAADRIGNGFSYLVAGESTVPIAQLARYSVTAAALLGPAQVASRLSKWARGDPVPFRSCATLSGIDISEPVDIGGGMRLEPLPLQLIPLPLGASAPERSEVKLTIELEGGPAFYNPANAPERERTWGGRPELLLDALCGALSLALNSCVTRRLSWSECDEIEGFNLTMGISWQTAPHSLLLGKSSPLSTGHTAEVEDLLQKQQADESADLGMAIRRWMRSKAQDGTSPTSSSNCASRSKRYTSRMRAVSSASAFRVAPPGIWERALRRGPSIRRRFPRLTALPRALCIRARSRIRMSIESYCEQHRPLSGEPF